MVEVLKDLTVHADPTTFDHFAGTMAMRMVAPWSSRGDQNQNLSDGAKVRAFRFRGEPAVTLYLAYKNGVGRVGNIVPEFGKLTVRQYNAILDDFVLRFVSPYASAFALNYTYTDNQAGNPQSVLSTEALNRLLEFSAYANKGTAATRAEDGRRWNAFIIQAHRDHARLDGELLKRWLVEDMKWPETVAWELAVEYESSRELLSAYDQTR